MTDQDLSDDDAIACVKLDEVYDVARGLYYASKILAGARKRLPPP